MTSVLPWQTSEVNSPGEFPRSNPGIGRPPRSPASKAEPGGRTVATAFAWSTSAHGMIASHPADRAWTITVVAQDINDHRDTAAETPRRDQAREQMDEDLGPVVWIHRRISRHTRILFTTAGPYRSAWTGRAGVSIITARPVLRERIEIGNPRPDLSRCMDARAKRAICSAAGPASIHRRSGAFRAPDPLGAGQPDDRPECVWRNLELRTRRDPPGLPSS